LQKPARRAFRGTVGPIGGRVMRNLVGETSGSITEGGRLREPFAHTCSLMAVIAGLLAGTPGIVGTELSAAESACLRLDRVTLSEPQFLMGVQGAAGGDSGPWLGWGRPTRGTLG
jgi:hypothetical protein